MAPALCEFHHTGQIATKMPNIGNLEMPFLPIFLRWGGGRVAAGGVMSYDPV